MERSFLSPFLSTFICIYIYMCVCVYVRVCVYFSTKIFPMTLPSKQPFYTIFHIPHLEFFHITYIKILLNDVKKLFINQCIILLMFACKASHALISQMITVSTDMRNSCIRTSFELSDIIGNRLMLNFLFYNKITFVAVFGRGKFIDIASPNPLDKLKSYLRPPVSGIALN